MRASELKSSCAKGLPQCPDVVENPLLGSDTLGWRGKCRAGAPHFSGGTSAAKISLPLELYSPHCGYGTACSISSPLLQVLRQLLYVLSYRISVKLVFMWFLMLIVLLFNGNIYVVVGGGENRVYIRFNFDMKPVIGSFQDEKCRWSGCHGEEKVKFSTWSQGWFKSSQVRGA